jgi:glycosyltransferase involved in cell wall biosynthesis
MMSAKPSNRLAKQTKHILIIVENLPVPLDRRVWQEATSLAQAGYEVSVICPRNRDYTKSYEFMAGVHIYRHYLPIEAKGIMGFILEYSFALVGELILAFKIYQRKRFHVIQACNPPDLIFLVAAPFKLIGVKFVFDHHDPFPELFQVKFPNRPWLYKATLMMERLTFRLADRVISTSESLRQLTSRRDKIDSKRIALVRSGPNLPQVRTVSNNALREGFPFLVLYIGIIGQQDGLDVLVRAIHHLVHQRNRKDILFLVVGDGPQRTAIEEFSSALEILPYIRFTGYLSGTPFFERLATADIGICPDAKNIFNDLLSMNKVMEYMSFGVPVVQFDLTENRELTRDAAVYAGSDNDPAALAEAITNLLDDPNRRKSMGESGRKRVETHLSWSNQVEAYLRVYRELLGAP